MTHEELERRAFGLVYEYITAKLPFSYRIPDPAPDGVYLVLFRSNAGRHHYGFASFTGVVPGTMCFYERPWTTVDSLFAQYTRSRSCGDSVHALASPLAFEVSHKQVRLCNSIVAEFNNGWLDSAGTYSSLLRLMVDAAAKYGGA